MIKQTIEYFVHEFSLIINPLFKYKIKNFNLYTYFYFFISKNEIFKCYISIFLVIMTLYIC